MAAGVTDRLWSVEDLVALWEAYEQRRAERAACGLVALDCRLFVRSGLARLSTSNTLGQCPWITRGTASHDSQHYVSGEKIKVAHYRGVSV